jgi:hypothetical protein
MKIGIMGAAKLVIVPCWDNGPSGVKHGYLPFIFTLMVEHQPLKFQGRFGEYWA